MNPTITLHSFPNNFFSRSGIILAQLLKLNGASRVVIVANKGIKTKIARQLDAGDEYVELERNDPDSQWAKMKEDYKDGFDVVVMLFHLPIRIFKRPLVD